MMIDEPLLSSWDHEHIKKKNATLDGPSRHGHNQETLVVNELPTIFYWRSLSPSHTSNNILHNMCAM